MITYYVVQTFQIGRKGVLIPDEPRQAKTRIQAEAMAERLAHTREAVVAFSRSGDETTGDYDDAVILAQHGNFPAHAFEDLMQAG